MKDAHQRFSCRRQAFVSISLSDFCGNVVNIVYCRMRQVLFIGIISECFMKIFILSFVLICASSFSSAHEIKELKVTRVWQDEKGLRYFNWMIADTVVTSQTQYISCTAFNKKYEPLFQKITRTSHFATQGQASVDGWKPWDVAYMRCAYD